MESNYEAFRNIVIKKSSSPKELVEAYGKLVEAFFELEERAFALLNMQRPEVAETIMRKE